MKFTTSILTIILASISGTATAVLSPYVTCCEDNNGTYKILNGSDGQSGFCQIDGVNTEEKTFYEQNCDKKVYHVFALNNCGTKVGADFELHTEEKGNYEKTVFVKKDHCKSIGQTDKETVTYTEFGGYIAGGNTSCESIIQGGNPECTKGVDSHNGKKLKEDGACVIKLC